MDLADASSRLMYAAAWCVGRVPRTWLQWLGVRLGRFARWKHTRESKVAQRNLEYLDPGQDPAERERDIRAILEQTGRNALETLRVWTRPREDNLRWIRAVEGREHMDAAIAAGRGLIIVAPHYGNWELMIDFVATLCPYALVYRVPESAAGDAFLRRVRGDERVHLVPAEGNAMRPLWKMLKAGGAVGITPDQQPKLGGGEFAPFFGHQALTMTLVPKLAERSGAAVVMAWAERGADGLFTAHFAPGPAAIASADLAEATAALNAAVEAIARRDRSQYQWTYKRYTLRPPGSGESNPYPRDCK